MRTSQTHTHTHVAYSAGAEGAETEVLIRSFDIILLCCCHVGPAVKTNRCRFWWTFLTKLFSSFRGNSRPELVRLVIFDPQREHDFGFFVVE